MDGQTKDLHLFTHLYPYGKENETFLDAEIEVLASAFSTIYIYPNTRSEQRRDSLPSNVQVIDLLNTPIKRRNLVIKLFLLLRFSPIILHTLRQTYNKRAYITHSKYYVQRLYKEIDLYLRLKSFFQKKNKHSIFYTYWFDNGLLALAILKKQGHIQKLFSRAHGYDLYDERNCDLPWAFRAFILANITRLFCVSKNGMNYLQTRFPQYVESISSAYLGINDANKKLEKTLTNEPLFVSVGSLIELKRTDLILDTLKHFDQPAKWVHFGSGSEMEKIKKLAAELPSSISYEIKGFVSNEELIRFYNNHEVTGFLSFSSSEGLPVSMMEAVSFGIPILACDVGGISEIVIPKKTGILLPVNCSSEDRLNGLNQLVTYPFDRQQIQDYFHLNFNATTNYHSFSKQLKSL